MVEYRDAVLRYHKQRLSKLEVPVESIVNSLSSMIAKEVESTTVVLLRSFLKERELDATTLKGLDSWDARRLDALATELATLQSCSFNESRGFVLTSLLDELHSFQEMAEIAYMQKSIDLVLPPASLTLLGDN